MPRNLQKGLQLNIMIRTTHGILFQIRPCTISTIDRNIYCCRGECCVVATALIQYSIPGHLKESRQPRVACPGSSPPRSPFHYRPSRLQRTIGTSSVEFEYASWPCNLPHTSWRAAQVSAKGPRRKLRRARRCKELPAPRISPRQLPGRIARNSQHQNACTHAYVYVYIYIGDMCIHTYK